MKRKDGLLILTGGLVLVPAAIATAAEEVTAERAPGQPASENKNVVDFNIATALFSILIFLGLLTVLGKFAWKPILIALQARESAIREGIEAAAKARAEADRTTKELEARIAEAQRVGQQQLLQAKADAQKLAEGIRAAAEAESAALRDRALRDIEGAKQQALAEINSHAAELGTAIAQKILQRAVTVEDQGRLVDESLAELARKN